jgi:hypothetical protein
MKSNTSLFEMCHYIVHILVGYAEPKLFGGAQGEAPLSCIHKPHYVTIAAIAISPINCHKPQVTKL